MQDLIHYSILLILVDENTRIVFVSFSGRQYKIKPKITRASSVFSTSVYNRYSRQIDWSIALQSIKMKHREVSWVAFVFFEGERPNHRFILQLLPSLLTAPYLPAVFQSNPVWGNLKFSFTCLDNWRWILIMYRCFWTMLTFLNDTFTKKPIPCCDLPKRAVCWSYIARNTIEPVKYSTSETLSGNAYPFLMLCWLFLSDLSSLWLP